MRAGVVCGLAYVRVGRRVAWGGSLAEAVLAWCLGGSKEGQA